MEADLLCLAISAIGWFLVGIFVGLGVFVPGVGICPNADPFVEELKNLLTNSIGQI